ncbi:MAG: dihydrolipoyllysine-residue acetyltransferase [Candidatus Dechloromonas phosphoritropha]|jgi:pyruvate dehydrogenase E2 component (dihydrolipoamide acetyltransferase)|nr:dihydrolipoyllysine-residue acetyltransferase [Candidatus Dechloromonas phosphoritropha]MBP8786890.1 dihydrolipoyllysine-residue acetyltransferase [Azonexus sp.]MBP9227291.1 dihydrolipoyllysine-residue acetyltransferase [Azonexus sp.]
MSQIIEVKVPDIGDFPEVPVIELFVKVGDSIAVDDAIVTLESDKATMDVPSTVAGVVKEVLVQLGSKVGEGSVLIKVETGAAVAATVAVNPENAPKTPSAAAVAAPVGGALVEVTVPDIGDFSDVPVIDLFVKVGDNIRVDDAIATLESDKATMDVPSTVSGVVKEVLIQLGSKVSEGAVLIKVETGAPAAAAQAAAAVPGAAAPVAAPVAAAPAALAPALPAGSKVHASPSVRAYARQLGVDLSKVSASGPKNRIVKEDLTKYVKGVMTGAISGPVASATGGVVGGGVLDLLPWPKVDFARFGEVEIKPLSRIKKISGQNLSRNWVMIPAVTYHEDADITDLEAFRVLLNKENEKTGNKLTMLAFLIKACVKAMQRYPEFNASLDGDNLVLKKYFNIGFAADTPNGLVVPVVKNADQKGVFEIARETGELARQARDGKLKPADMSGACFTISSVGGIGGTYFAPIVNAPEVAILGVNRSAMKPVWDGKQFVPRLTLPLSLTADHRVIDGALATRFNVYVAELLADMRRMIV